MVDFQSRDTSRGLSSDDDDEEETEAQAEPEETAETTEAEPGESTETEPEESTGAETEPEESTGAETEPAEAPAGDAAQDHEGGTARERARDGAETSRDHGQAEDSHDHGHAEGGHDHGHAHADHHHGDVEQLGVAVVTVSSSRDLDDDPSGDAIQSLVEGDGHSVVARDLVADDLDSVQRAVLALTGREDVDVVVTTGGTGVTPDDVTVEAVRPLFDKELPGFGELFRILSYEEVGTRALGSRATAGVSEGVPVFCLPGSEDAVRTGVEELILAEAPHLVGLANGD
jgi:molybdenum cofactor biosynthesis protein B